MAQVPGVPLPDVAASSAPTPTQDVRPPAEAFGLSAGGDILAAAGHTADQVSTILAQHAQQFQAINNKVAVDSATNSVIAQTDDARLAYEKNYPGLAAANPVNLATFHQTLNDIHASNAQGLSPEASVEYDATSRRYIGAATAATATYAQSQRVKGINSQAAATKQIWAGKMAASPDDPVIQDEGAKQIAQNNAMLQALNGWSDEETQAHIQADLGGVYQGQIHNAVNSGNQGVAQQLLSQHKDDMTEQQLTAALGEVKAGQTSHEAASIALDFGAGKPISLDLQGAQIPNTDFVSGIERQEGIGSNPRSSAVGTGQFIQKTWLDTLKGDPQFAGVIAGKSDADILALRNDPTIAKQAIQSYAATNNRALTAAGLPASQANLSLAHGFGAEGATQILNAPATTPVSAIFSPQVMAANPNLLNKTAGDLVASANSRFGGASPGQTVTPPNIANYTDANKYEADALAVARQIAESPRYAADPDQALRSFNAMKAQINDNATQLRVQRNAVYSDALGMVQQNNLSDVSQLPPSVVAKLSPQEIQTLSGDIQVDANRVTPARQDNLVQLVGMQANNPDGFSKVDLKAVDLPAAQRTKLMEDQQKGLTTNGPIKEPDNLAKTALASSVVGQQAVSALGLAPADRKTDVNKATQFDRLTGLVSGDIDAYTAAHGKPPVPGSKEMNDIITKNVTSVSTPTLFGFGKPAVTQAVSAVPDAERAKIVAAANERGQSYVPESQIASLYRRMHPNAK